MGGPSGRAGSGLQAPQHHFFLVFSHPALPGRDCPCGRPCQQTAAGPVISGVRSGPRQWRLWGAAWTLALPPSWALLYRAGAAAALNPQNGETLVIPGTAGRKQKPATKATCPWSCGGPGAEMRVASGLKLQSFNYTSLPSAGARQVRPMHRYQDTWVPRLGSANCLMSLCFHFPALLVATAWLSVLVALGWLVLQTDLLGVVS